MDKRNFQRLKMLNNVNDVLIGRENIWTSSAVFKKAYQKFGAAIKEITEFDQLADKGVSTTAKKDQAKQFMIEQSLIGAGAGMAYASSINNNELKALFDYSKSSLSKGSEIEICNNCHKVYTDLFKIKDALVPDYLETEELESIKEAIDIASSLLDKPQGVRRKSKSNKENMEAAFKKALSILDDEIDSLIIKYKSKYPEFYTEYSNARVIGGWKKKKDDEDDAANPSDSIPTE